MTTFKAGFEQCFIEAGDPVEEITLSPTEPPTREAMNQLNALASKYGVEILGPPPWAE